MAQLIYILKSCDISKKNVLMHILTTKCNLIDDDILTGPNKCSNITFSNKRKKEKEKRFKASNSDLTEFLSICYMFMSSFLKEGKNGLVLFVLSCTVISESLLMSL